MRTETPFIVMSAELAELSPAENQRRSLALIEWLTRRGHSFKPVEGCYKGRKESAFIVLVPDREREKQIMSLARAYRQESVLYADANRQAYLRLLESGEEVPIGSWRAVPKAQALACPAYTRDIVEDRYYVAS